ncbi:MAG: energy-coupling factor transporter transmembrane component T [Nocardioides sp.]
MTLAAPVLAARLPRDLHPVAWWVWALGLAVAASLTTNAMVLFLLLAVVTLVVTLRRGDQPWARSFRLYVWVGVVIVVVRVGFRIIFGGSDGSRVLLALPQIPLPDWVLGIRLLGPVTQDALVVGFCDGLRLATIVICVGAANALANPKRLLRSVPPALYEIGTALVVAVSVLPQLADSVRRVRAARDLRGGATGRVGRLRRLLVPVLEDALERSLALAAGMDTRGYGRAPGLTASARRRTGALMLAGLCGILVGTYAVLDHTAPRVLALPMLVLGLALAVAGLGSAGQRVSRTRYRPDHWRWPELLVACSGVVTAMVGWWVSHHQLGIAFPSPADWPQVSAAVLVGALVALAGALCSPAPRTAEVLA